MKHTLAGWMTTGKARFDYRPVHLNTLTDEVKTVPPEKRVY